MTPRASKVIEVLAHQGFVVTLACLALQALRDEIGDVGRTAAACNELEVDDLHLVAVEEQVVGADVAVQQHVAFGQRGQCRHRSLQRTLRRTVRRAPEPSRLQLSR